MNRIIKFRVWDGLNKKMSYWTMNDLCTWDTKEEKPSAFYEWMQSTGLLDKNGKEIYEGDILECESMRDMIELGWSTGEATDNGYGMIWSTSKNLITKQDGISDRFKIIGNIYE